jgi:hypothetical protein
LEGPAETPDLLEEPTQVTSHVCWLSTMPSKTQPHNHQDKETTTRPRSFTCHDDHQATQPRASVPLDFPPPMSTMRHKKNNHNCGNSSNKNQQATEKAQINHRQTIDSTSRKSFCFFEFLIATNVLPARNRSKDTYIIIHQEIYAMDLPRRRT